MTGIPVVDIFAGPGGLSEGFSRFQNPGEDHFAFNNRLSIEKDHHSWLTLRLRSFKRKLKTQSELNAYLSYIAGRIDLESLWSAAPEAAELADLEAWQAELGVADVGEVRERVQQSIEGSRDWVLLGGPPCQAYSVVGRSRMIPTIGRNEFDKDPRHQLYKEYLRILADHAPAVFVFENVRGILSSSVMGRSVFENILKDLRDPSRAINDGPVPLSTPMYELLPIAAEQGRIDGEFSPQDFIIKSEDYGVPQARHRVIIIGVRSDIWSWTTNHTCSLKKTMNRPSVKDVIGDLPPIRSSLSAPSSNYDDWIAQLRWMAGEMRSGESLHTDASIGKKIAKVLRTSFRRTERSILETSSSKKVKKNGPKYNPSDWYRTSEIKWITNHESRGHMATDLHRYLYYAAFGEVVKKSPNLSEIPRWLLPAHKNVQGETGAKIFSDRFRVQLATRPATTITSHIAKDGHAFIHYDPSQCRSFTVREAARVQMFSDDYHFEGPRTSQYAQVGNAVPPYLAYQIAGVVKQLLMPAVL